MDIEITWRKSNPWSFLSFIGVILVRILVEIIYSIDPRSEQSMARTGHMRVV